MGRLFHTRQIAKTAPEARRSFSASHGRRKVHCAHTEKVSHSKISENRNRASSLRVVNSEPARPRVPNAELIARPRARLKSSQPFDDNPNR